MVHCKIIQYCAVFCEKLDEWVKHRSLEAILSDCIMLMVKSAHFVEELTAGGLHEYMNFIRCDVIKRNESELTIHKY